MRDVPRVYQVDTVHGTTSYVGDVHEQGLVVGRNTLPLSGASANGDMSRMHFTLGRTPEGDIGLVDHSTNGTAVLYAEQLDRTKEHTVARQLGQTVVTPQIKR